MELIHETPFFASGLVRIVVICLFAVLPALAQDAKDLAAAKRSIEVAKFEIREKVEFPATARDTMMAEIVDELTKLKKFEFVKPFAASPTTTTDGSGIASDTPTDLTITGTVVEYKPGNRVARYFVGFGAGKTKVVAAIKITERATGKVLLEKNVDGKVVIGFFGGDSNGATRGLARQVAKDIKKALFK